MIYVLFWVCFAIILGVAANTRGRSGFGWTLLALVFSPILIGLLLFALPRLENNPLGDIDIKTLALIEATPEGSRSRQWLAEVQANHKKDIFAPVTNPEELRLRIPTPEQIQMAREYLQTHY